MINKIPIKNGSSRFKNLIASALTACSLFGTSLHAQPLMGSLDIVALDKNTVIDSKLSLDPTKNVNIFGRNRTTFDYSNGSKTPFTLVDLSYNWNNGLGIVTEVQFPDGRNPDPRLGFQYFKRLNNFSLYAEATAGNSKTLNAELVITPRYSQTLSSNLNAIAQIETLTDFDKSGLTFATQRCKLGLGIGKSLEVGLQLDATEIPHCNLKSINRTVGGYLTYKF